ncbi:MAG: superoxide dismutase, Ni [Anaerolineales bacterium]|nr:superoxide dismutase, Ni [Anaerolineales bacterium]
MFYKLVETLDKKLGFEQAKAHCDIPCGIYDPITAQIAAVTVVRMIDLMTDLESKGGDKGMDYVNSMSRYVEVKEEHAEKAKHDIRVIWGDYIKAQHLEKFPELNALTHKIMQFGSKSRQTTDRQAALDFVEAINQFAEIFWATKNIPTKKVKSPYNPPLELVYPVLG